MNRIKIYQVDAFTDNLFSGNPAAVCILPKWLNDEKMQNIATENNLAETAFLVENGDDFEIRWFTPTVEVDLCRHATLATAYVLFNCLNFQGNEIVFHSSKSGKLSVSKENDLLLLNFPADQLENAENFEQIRKCIGITPRELYKGKTDYIAVISNEEEVKNLCPDLYEISKLKARGLIVTAPGEKVDFVSRFFAPQSGINEDPVTGSAHTSLIPIWSAKTGKQEMTARQLSKRGGDLMCINNNGRVSIGGKGKLYMEGEIFID